VARVRFDDVNETIEAIGSDVLGRAVIVYD
jgi:hypothetical protein